MVAVTSCVNARNNVMQISFFGGGGGVERWRGGAGEVNKGQGYNMT